MHNAYKMLVYGTIGIIYQSIELHTTQVAHLCVSAYKCLGNNMVFNNIKSIGLMSLDLFTLYRKIIDCLYFEAAYKLFNHRALVIDDVAFSVHLQLFAI